MTFVKDPLESKSEMVPPSSSHGPKKDDLLPIKEAVNLAPYQSAQQKKEIKKNKGKKLSQVNSISGV